MRKRPKSLKAQQVKRGFEYGEIAYVDVRATAERVREAQDAILGLAALVLPLKSGPP